MHAHVYSGIRGQKSSDESEMVPGRKSSGNNDTVVRVTPTGLHGEDNHSVIA